MQRKRSAAQRDGSILPLLLVCLAALCGFVALALDIGQIALARTQCQAAADAAAMAGARALDGSPSANTAAATEAALATAAANEVLSQPIAVSEVVVQHGAYRYDYGREEFVPDFTPTPPEVYSLTQVSIRHPVFTMFAWVFNVGTVWVSASATAAHRPRDVCFLIDLSGPLNAESSLWNCDPSLPPPQDRSNHSDPSYPQFGWYDPAFSPAARLCCAEGGSGAGRCNITQPVGEVPPLVHDFYQNDRGAIPVPAFDPAPASVTPTAPAGDRPAAHIEDGIPARNWEDITGSPAFPFLGYDALNQTFHGWTQGPGYWGKTFFLWPPDPTSDEAGHPRDWRKRFFFLADGVTPNNDNTHLPLAGPDGRYPDPPGHYRINYRAILAWIRDHCVQRWPGDGNPFPPRLRAGNVLYYDQIPDDVPAAAYDHRVPNSQISDFDRRFWKEYIDYVLGVWRDPLGVVHHAGTPGCGLGPDFPCGTRRKKADVQLSGPDGREATWAALDRGASVPFMSPSDNPLRPRHRFWFGPLTMIQFLLDAGLLPGTAHDITTHPTKTALAAALLEQRHNHLNDLVALLPFSRPPCVEEAGGDFGTPQHALSRDYSRLVDSLWLPLAPSAPDVRPWAPAAGHIPHVHGHYGPSRATAYAFMLAYNQLSSSGELRGQIVTGQAAGGLGRRGAQRVLILLTSGPPDLGACPSPPITNNGPGHSYYNILPGQAVHAHAYSEEDLLHVVQSVCGPPEGAPPGYGKASRPVLVHTLAVGPFFERDHPDLGSTVQLLQRISRLGGTVFPASPADPDNGCKWCIGDVAQRQARLRQALRIILDDSSSIVLVH